MRADKYGKIILMRVVTLASSSGMYVRWKEGQNSVNRVHMHRLPPAITSYAALVGNLSSTSALHDNFILQICNQPMNEETRVMERSSCTDSTDGSQLGSSAQAAALEPARSLLGSAPAPNVEWTEACRAAILRSKPGEKAEEACRMATGTNSFGLASQTYTYKRKKIGWLTYLVVG
jgi:hypothetical protein